MILILILDCDSLSFLQRLGVITVISMKTISNTVFFKKS